MSIELKQAQAQEQEYKCKCKDYDTVKAYNIKLTKCSECNRILLTSDQYMDLTINNPKSEKSYIEHLERRHYYEYKTDIDVNWFKEQLKKQNSKCYFTEVELKLNFDDLFHTAAPTILNHVYGHIKSNTVLATRVVSRLRNDMNYYDFLNRVLSSRIQITKYDSRYTNNCMRYNHLPVKISFNEIVKLANANNHICAITGVQGTWDFGKWNRLTVGYNSKTKSYFLVLANIGFQLINREYSKKDILDTMRKISAVHKDALNNQPKIKMNLDEILKKYNYKFLRYDNDIDTSDRSFIVINSGGKFIRTNLLALNSKME